jgi:hypothetical protein
LTRFILPGKISTGVSCLLQRNAGRLFLAHHVVRHPQMELNLGLIRKLARTFL